MARVALALAVIVALAAGLLHWIGSGGAGSFWEEGQPVARRLSTVTLDERALAQTAAASGIGVPRPKQVLFGDLHVHTTFSPDAFAMALPMSGGSGAKPISHACDYARFCAALDFWSDAERYVRQVPEERDGNSENPPGPLVTRHPHLEPMAGNVESSRANRLFLTIPHRSRGGSPGRRVNPLSHGAPRGGLRQSPGSVGDPPIRH